MRRFGWIALIVFLGWGEALADGHNLLLACKMIGQDRPADYHAFESGLCIGLVQGVRQTLVAYSDLLPREHHICVPRTVSNKQSVEIIVSYLETHPNQMYLPEVALAIQAHREAFACQ